MVEGPSWGKTSQTTNSSGEMILLRRSAGVKRILKGVQATDLGVSPVAEGPTGRER
jgi:hypothetical protein